MSQYLTTVTFVDASLMPPEYAAAIETMHPGWLDKALTRWSAWIDARLSKRYATPFPADSPPDVVVEWLNRIVTHRCYMKRGVDSTDAQVVDLKADALAAVAEITEAASSATGLFELPLRQDAAAVGGVSRGDALCYSEASPYTWTELQLENSVDEGWGLR